MIQSHSPSDHTPVVSCRLSPRITKEKGEGEIHDISLVEGRRRGSFGDWMGIPYSLCLQISNYQSLSLLSPSHPPPQSSDAVPAMNSNTAGKQQKATEVATTAVVIKDEPNPSSYAQMTLNSFWPSVMGEVRRIKAVDAKNQQLPLARIKKIMKLDEDVKMISAEAPLLFAKAAEIFIHELTLMAWVFTEENKRRTLQRSDIAMALSKYDQFDFLIDIVPREEVRAAAAATTPPTPAAGKKEEGGKAEVEQEVGNSGAGVKVEVASDPNKPDSSAQIQYYLQLAQQQRQAMTLQNSNVMGGGTTIVQQVVSAGEGDTGSSSSATPSSSSLSSSGTATGPSAAVQVASGGSGLHAGSIITAGGQTIPLATLLAQQQQQQQQNHSNLLSQIQFQPQPQTQQIITLSNGQQILVGGGQQQHHQVAQGTPLLTAGGQVIGSIPQQPQQQFHILQQIMSPTGEIQHIQVSVGGGGGVVEGTSRSPIPFLPRADSRGHEQPEPAADGRWRRGGCAATADPHPESAPAAAATPHAGTDHGHDQQRRNDLLERRQSDRGHCRRSRRRDSRGIRECQSSRYVRWRPRG